MTPQPPDIDLESIRKSEIVASDGTEYAAFRRTLTPRYSLVWFHVFCGYVALGAIAFAIAYLGRMIPLAWSPVPVIAGAALVGFAIHYLHLFMHEGSHYNLAKNRKWNDRLANLFIGTVVGMHMKPYRPTHFDHHRHLGTPKDTEISYFDPLNMLFIVESVLGLRVLKTMINRNRSHRFEGIGTNVHERMLAYRALFITALLHLSVMTVAVWNGAYVLALSWGFGAYGFYPLFGSLRTLLEHRSEHADRHVDYTKVNHGKTNRMFGVGPFAVTFGNAGFNRHLLHHWDPQVSYTRLRDLERYLMDTDICRDVINGHRTTYSKTFVKLYNR